MLIIPKAFFATAAAAVLILSLTGISSYQQQQPPVADGEGPCIGYEEGVNTITITCNASFLDVVHTIKDPAILEQEEGEVGQYILKANLEVADGVTFEMTSSGADNLRYLKIAGANGIIVYGKILINGVKITSWDVSDDDVVQQDMNGTIPRGYVQFAASEGSQVINSEFGYLGDVEPGRRGFDLFGGGGPSHDIEIRGSKFHDMWMAFYSKGAYNITVDGNEYFNNIKYSLDPHTSTHNMNITNNSIHDNPIGPICSDRCWDILIDGNLIEDTDNAAIFFSRNMTDSIARNNHVINARTGIIVSESPNNQIYNNTIEGATREGIGLINPELIDDGLTEANLVYDNVISNSDFGIRAMRSQNNIVENTTFSDIESSEYHLAANSNLMIRGQQFDNTLITGGGEDATTDIAADTPIENHLEIAGSGIIEVTEGENDGEDDDGEGEENSYNTDTQPYTTTLGDGDSITVNS
jgi:mannuronan 5-epimerase